MRYFIRTISKGWTLIKCVLSSLYNLAETLHIYGKNSKDTHVAKKLKSLTQKYDVVLCFPEGLVQNTPFRYQIL